MTHDAPCTLTVGIIARNGERTIERCIESVRSLDLPPATRLEVILVDGGSSDATGNLMLRSASFLSCTRVFRVEGEQNASIARNVVLRNAAVGFVLLLDGDIVLHPQFARRAIEGIWAGHAAAATGPLWDVLIDENNKRSLRRVHPGPYPRAVKHTGGILMLAPKTAKSFSFDEGLRRNEDIDFSLRIAKHGTILFIEQEIGDHLTVDYYSRGRIFDWVGEVYDSYAGVLIRKHFFDLRSLGQLLRNESGIVAGAILQTAFVAAVLYQPLLSPIVFAVGVADLLRLIRKGKGRRFIPQRLVAPYMVLYGFLLKPREKNSFSVTRLV